MRLAKILKFINEEEPEDAGHTLVANFLHPFSAKKKLYRKLTIYHVKFPFRKNMKFFKRSLGNRSAGTQALVTGSYEDRLAGTEGGGQFPGRTVSMRVGTESQI